MEQSLLAHISHQTQNGELTQKLDRTQSTSHHLGEIRDDYGDQKELLREKLESCLFNAVSKCLETQNSKGAWLVVPDGRIFDTALVGYALSKTLDPKDINRIEQARRWVANAKPQNHCPVAYLIENLLRKILLGEDGIVDISDPQLLTPVFANRTALLYTLALHAGLKVQAPFGEEVLRKKIAEMFEQCKHDQLKKLWSKVEIVSMHILLEAKADNWSAVQTAHRELLLMQSSDGSFAFNPISTAMAYIALSVAAPDSTAWQQSKLHLLNNQESDGSWRYFTNDVWDTVLTVRSFRGYPMFDLEALPSALNFLQSVQNSDGGWSFRTLVESDNDTTAAALLALSESPQGEAVAPKALAYLANQQMENGLWRTWQFKSDPPIADVVAHVVSALDAYKDKHSISVLAAKQWLTEQYEENQTWQSWYRIEPYLVTEISQALDMNCSTTQLAVKILEDVQNPDGGWGFEPGSDSNASATGLALAALIRKGYRIDRSSVYKALEFLIETQQSDGTWQGFPQMYGPRPLLNHYQTHTQAFAVSGILDAWKSLSEGNR